MELDIVSTFDDCLGDNSSTFTSFLRSDREDLGALLVKRKRIERS
jgi:hypothetical protein